jgi:hypothetical protein
MTWNFRFIVFEDTFLPDEEGAQYIELCEVFYDAAGNLSAYSRPHLTFDDADEITTFLEQLTAASKQPFLHEDDFPAPDTYDDAFFFCDPPTED